MDRSKTQKGAKKKDLKRHKTSKRRKKSESSSDESVDLSEKMYPIAHYMDNRQEMIEQVFSVMEREKLNCMLPPILKGMSISLLKEKCLNELTNMSDDEVRKVLCGEPLQTQSEKALSVPQPDSDSCDSISSIEECSNQKHEQRTLLDILEQEMQAIAYTVMKKDDNCLSSSSDDLLEIIPIPVDPASNKNAACSVPLVCIDSDEDDIPPYAAVSPPVIDISVEPSVEKDSDVAEVLQSSGTSDSTILGCAIEGNEICSESKGLNRKDIEPTSNHSKDNNDEHQTSMKPLESILIQVFPKKTAPSERVVKKVYRTSGSEKDENKGTPPNISQHSSDCICVTCKTQTAQGTSEKQIDCKILANNGETCEDGISSQTIDESLASEIANLPDQHDCQLDLGAQHSSGSLENSPGSCSLAEARVNQEEKVDSAKEGVADTACDEKEEGEISERESEEEIAVVETMPNYQRSPTIFLSSDSNDASNDLEQNESRTKHHKHHRRHKKNKRTLERSPERSKRRIEKRGNRSYRRKTTSSGHEILKSTEDEKEQTKNVGKSTSVANFKNFKNPEDGLEGTKTLNNSTSDEKLDMETDNKETKSLAKEQQLLECSEQTVGSRGNKESVDESSTCEGNQLNSSDETEELEDAEPLSDKTSWADRWAKKKNLNKVVITSKICRNVRKRILSARKKQICQETSSAQTPALPPVPPLVLHVEGSVQEYQMLQLLVSDVCEESKSTGIEKDNSINTADMNFSQANNGETEDLDVTEVVNKTSSHKPVQNSNSDQDVSLKPDLDNQEPQNEIKHI